MKKTRRKIQEPQSENYCIDSDAEFYYIAGYTSGGAPYGVTWKEIAEQEQREAELQRLRNAIVMSAPVKIADIVSELNTTAYEITKYLNKETGNIVTVYDDQPMYEDSGEDDPPAINFKTHDDELAAALDIRKYPEKYIELPNRYDIDIKDIAARFCHALEDQKKAKALMTACRRKGGIRRLKNMLRQYNMENIWQHFYVQELTVLSIRWCEENNLMYI